MLSLGRRSWPVLISLALLSVFVITDLLASNRSTQSEQEAFQRFWPDNLFAVDFVDEKHGFIGGYSGTFLSTEDGGESWQAGYVGSNELIRRISFINPQVGWAVGHRGSIFHTQDGGHSWNVQKKIENTYLRDISFLNENVGWAVGHDAVILFTRDGGRLWKRQYLTDYSGRDLPRLHGIEALSPSSAMLVGEFGTIAYTSDEGDTWSLVENESDKTLLDLTVVHQEPALEFLAAGLDGTIQRIALASEAERKGIRDVRLKKAQRQWRKDRSHARRRGDSFDMPEPIDVELHEREFTAVMVPSNTTENLFAIKATTGGKAYAVGRAVFLEINGSEPRFLEPAEGLPFAYMWLGGVDVTPQGSIWSVGIRGNVVRGAVGDSAFAPALSLAKPENIEKISSRWDRRTRE